MVSSITPVKLRNSCNYLSHLQHGNSCRESQAHPVLEGSHGSGLRLRGSERMELMALQEALVLNVVTVWVPGPLLEACRCFSRDLTKHAHKSVLQAGGLWPRCLGVEGGLG